MKFFDEAIPFLAMHAVGASMLVILAPRILVQSLELLTLCLP